MKLINKKNNDIDISDSEKGEKTERGLRFLLTQSKIAAVEARSDSTGIIAGHVARFQSLSYRMQGFIMTAMFVGYYAMFASFSWANRPGCQQEATDRVLALLDSATKFIMAIVGGLAVLAFVIGGALIVAGGTSSRVKMGMTLLKNALIGLGVVAAAGFIQFVVLDLISGATGTDTAGCLEKGNENSDFR